MTSGKTIWRQIFKTLSEQFLFADCFTALVNFYNHYLSTLTFL